MRIICIVTAVTCVLGSSAALAQTPAPRSFRGFVSVNGGFQVTSNDFADAGTKREHLEDGRLETTYVVKGGQTFDITGGTAVWRRLGIGVGVSRFTVDTPTTITASVPHPFFFNRLRPVNGEAPGLTREELVIHVQARATLPVGSRAELTVFGGPSFFKVKQGMVTDVSYRDSYPYDQASFGGAVTTTTDASKTGFGGGGDLAFYFSRNVGIGGTFQFAGASVDVPGTGGATRQVKVGGARTGAGLRLRF